MNNTSQKVEKSWTEALGHMWFRKRLLLGLLCLSIILSLYAPFFRYVEQRNGFLLNDWLLDKIPPADVSTLIFICIWGMGLLFAIRAFYNPSLFLTFLIAYTLLSLMRVTCIFLIPLEPPVLIVELQDKLISIFVGPKFITKDLFFSGHASTMALLFFCLNKKWDKRIAGAVTLLTSVLLLVQHVHYTIDIVVAPFFSYIAFRFSKKWLL